MFLLLLYDVTPGTIHVSMAIHAPRIQHAAYMPTITVPAHVILNLKTGRFVISSDLSAICQMCGILRLLGRNELTSGDGKDIKDHKCTVRIVVCEHCGIILEKNHAPVLLPVASRMSTTRNDGSCGEAGIQEFCTYRDRGLLYGKNRDGCSMYIVFSTHISNVKILLPTIRLAKKEGCLDWVIILSRYDASQCLQCTRDMWRNVFNELGICGTERIKYRIKNSIK